jgi:hypothetical protein
MVLAGQFRRACAVGLLSAAMVSAGMLAVSRASGRQWRRCARRLKLISEIQPGPNDWKGGEWRNRERPL